MSKYTDDLKTLILEHEHVIQNHEARIDDLPTDVSEAQIVLIRSQLEFFALNVRALKQSKGAGFADGRIRSQCGNAPAPPVPHLSFLPGCGEVATIFYPMARPSTGRSRVPRDIQ